MIAMMKQDFMQCIMMIDGLLHAVSQCNSVESLARLGHTDDMHQCPSNPINVLVSKSTSHVMLLDMK